MYKFFKNLSFLTILQISNTLIPLLVIPYVSRIISFDNFGALEFTRIFCYYFTIVINYGFDLTTTRQISIHRNDITRVNEIISQTFYAKLLLFIASSIVFILFLGFNESLQELWFLLLMTFLINIGYTLFPVWYFQGTEKLAFVATLNFVVKVLIALLTIVLIKESADYWKYNFLQSVSLILVGLLSVYLLYAKYSFVLQKFNLKLVTKVLKAGFPVFLGSILVTFITSLFFLFLKAYSSENELSIFSTSNKIIATLQGLILLPFSQAFFPIIARDAVTNFERFKLNINRVFYLLFACTFLMGAIVFFFGDLIITIIFGSNYVVAFDSLKILAFLPMFSAFTNIFAYQGLLSLKKDRLFLIIHIVFAVLSILLSILLLDRYTAVTASWIRLIIEILLFLTAYLFYKRSIIKRNATS